MAYRDLYRAWNEALHDYYITGATDEIVLYIDDDIFTQIGRTKTEITEDLQGLSYVDHFLRIMLNKNIDARRSICPMCGNGAPTLQEVIVKLTEFSSRIRLHGTSKDKIHCLPFAILILYLYAKHSYQTNVNEFLRNKINEEINFSIVSVLWKRISTDTNGRFDADRLAEGYNQRYAGRLKYHLLLSPSQRAQFKRIITDHHLVWDEIQESFVYFINNKVWQHLTPELKEKLNDQNTRCIFEALARECSEQEHVPATDNLSSKKLLYVYCRRLINDSCMEFLLFKSDEPSPEYLVMVAGEIKRTKADILYAENVHDLSIESVPHQEDILSYTIGNVTYSPYRKSVIFLKSVGNNIFEQVLQPEPGFTYIVVHNTANSNILNGQNHYDITQTVSVFRNGATISFVESWQGRISETSDDEGTGNLNTEYPHITGGINTHEIRGTYISSALPYIEFDNAEDAQRASISWRLSRLNEGNLENNLIEITNPWIVDNRIYLNGAFELKDGGNIVELKINDKPIKYLRVSKETSSSYNTQYSYDKYGNCVDHIIQMPESCLEHTISHQIDQNQTILKKTTKPAILYDILAEYANNGILEQREFINVLRYVFRYYNINGNDITTESIIKELKSLNCFIGFRDPYTQHYTNQIQKPILVKTSFTRRQLSDINLYMVYGCYTTEFVSKLAMIVGENKIFYHTQSGSVCIPDAVLVELDSEECKRTVATQLNTEIRETPIAYDIISYMSSKSECDNRYLTDDGTEEPSDRYTSDYPFIKNIGKIYLHYVRRGRKLQKSTYLIPETNCYEYIPVHYMKAHICSEKNKPILICKPNTRDIRQIHTFNSISFSEDMGRHPLLDMALCEMNLGLPKKVYVFILDYNEHTKRLVLPIDQYNTKINGEAVEKIIEKITGVNIKNRWGEQSHALLTQQYNKGEYKLFYNVKNESLRNVERLILTKTGKAIAYVQKTESNISICYLNQNNNWELIDNKDVNPTISAIIKNDFRDIRTSQRQQDIDIPDITEEYKSVELLKIM